MLHARFSNLPIILRHQGPLNVPLRHQGPNFLFSPSGYLDLQDSPLLYLGFPISPLCIIKTPKIFHNAIIGPQFPHHVIEMMTSNFPSHYIIYCVIKERPSSCDLEFPITLSRGPNLSLRHQGSIASSKGPNFPKCTMFITSMRYVLIKRPAVFKII